MSGTLIAIVTVIYVFTALSFFFAGNRPMAVVFVGYAIANVGLILSTRPT